MARFRNNKILITVLAGCVGLSGIAIIGYYVITNFSADENWQIVVEPMVDEIGNELRQQAHDTVQFFLNESKQGLSTSDLEQALLLIPRVKDVSVSVQPGRKLVVEVSERSTWYLTHGGPSFAEVARDGRVIQEGITKLHDELTADMPIFYLTANQTKEQYTILSDIISLWKRTRTNYPYLWQRISEIEINEKTVRIFLANIRAQVAMNNRFDDAMLERLWAVCYYLETRAMQNKTKDLWNKIELTSKNAVLREVSL